MNEPTAIIPIAPVTGINALIESKRQVGLKDFANMSSEFRPPGRDSLCPFGAAFVSTMPRPFEFLLTGE